MEGTHLQPQPNGKEPSQVWFKMILSGAERFQTRLLGAYYSDP